MTTPLSLKDCKYPSDPNKITVKGDKAKIELRSKYGEVRGYALIDSDRLDLVSKYKWFLDSLGYVSNRAHNIRIHRLLMNNPKNVIVDHIDGDKLNNCLSNLRLATQSQNLLNRGKPKNNTSGFKGVYWNSTVKKWGCWTKLHGKTVNFGWYKNKVSAARAYDRGIIKCHGEFAKTNFATK